MSYTYELIRQELERYNANDIPVSDEEIKFFKEHIPFTFRRTTEEKTDSIETFKDMLDYIYGRSWYWSRLMDSVGLSETMKLEDIDVDYLMHEPLFVVGLHVAMYRLCGFKIEVKETVVEKPISKPIKVNKAKRKK